MEHDLAAARKAAEAAEKLAAERGAALAAAVWRLRELEVGGAKSGAYSPALRMPQLQQVPPSPQLDASAAAESAADAGASSRSHSASPPPLCPRTPVAAAPAKSGALRSFAVADSPELSDDGGGAAGVPNLEPKASLRSLPSLPSSGLGAARSGSMGARAGRSLSRRLSSSAGFCTLEDANLGEPGLPGMPSAASLASSTDAFYDARSDAASVVGMSATPGSIAVAVLQASLPHTVSRTHSRPSNRGCAVHAACDCLPMSACLFTCAVRESCQDSCGASCALCVCTVHACFMPYLMDKCGVRVEFD